MSNKPTTQSSTQSTFQHFIFTVGRASMRTLTLAAAGVAMGGLGMGNANAADSAPTSTKPVKAAKADVPQEYAADADIGTVTRLALAVTVEEYRKKLRELRQPSAAAGRASGPALADPLPGAGAAGATTAAATRAVKPENQVPQIASISGSNTALNAVLAGGRTLRRGDVVQLSTVRWTVQSITPGGVQFERCEGHQCQAQTIPVSGRI